MFTTFQLQHDLYITSKANICLQQTNTFQMVLVTDEVFGYAIFNYKDIQWTSHTEAGGDTTSGEGGTTAYVSMMT